MTSSVSGKRATAAPIARAALCGADGGGYGIRTRVHGFAGRCLASRPTHHECFRIHVKRRSRRVVERAAPRSGRPDSNRRPSPWQGDALPTELRPHIGWADGGTRYAPPTGGANAEAPQCPRSPQGSGCSRTQRLGSGARPVAGARPMWPAGRRLRGSTVARDDEDLGVGRRRSCRLRDLNPVHGPRPRGRQEVRSWVP